MTRLQDEIERRVHRDRPAKRHLDGDELLADLMARVAGDACQLATVEPLDRGYREDPGAMKALRFMLRALDACREKSEAA